MYGLVWFGQICLVEFEFGLVWFCLILFGQSTEKPTK